MLKGYMDFSYINKKIEKNKISLILIYIIKKNETYKWTNPSNQN